MRTSRTLLICVAAAIAASTLTVLPAAADEPAPPAPPVANIPVDELPQFTQDRIAELEASGAEVHSVTSDQYATGEPDTKGGFQTLGYGVAPCYLTVIVSRQFGVGGPTGYRVDNESLTGCTGGTLSTVEHDQDIYKKDAIFGTVSVVASAVSNGGFGGYDSTVSYYCPTTAGSGFMAVTGGQITWNGTIYGAAGTDGYYTYNCG